MPDTSKDDEHPQYYEYTGLKHREIRLLSISRGSGHLGLQGQICVELHVQKLDDAKFEAISYTWGPSTYEEEEYDNTQIFTTVPRCYPVLCGGKIVPITKSLRNALRQIRTIEEPSAAALWKGRTGREKLPFVWADGICINQDDIREREQQVALMAELYTRASLVLACLEDCTEIDRVGLETAILLERFGRANESALNNKSANVLLDDPAVWQKIGAEPPTPKQWWAYVDFMTRPWFRRTWILQEAALKFEGDVVILCGRLLVWLNPLLGGLEVIVAAKWSMFIANKLLTFAEQHDIPLPRQRIAYSWISGNHPHFFVSLMWQGKSRISYQALYYGVTLTHCSNPRDKIYATLGLALDWEQLDTQQLPIDYTLDVDQVFCLATRYLLRRNDNGNILSLATSVSESKHGVLLPSWCHDFAAENLSPNPICPIDEDLIAGYKAAGRSTISLPALQEPWSQLTLRGLPRDLINTQTELGLLYGGLQPTLRVLQLLRPHMTPELGTFVISALHRCLTLHEKEPSEHPRLENWTPYPNPTGLTWFWTNLLCDTIARSSSSGLERDVSELVHLLTSVQKVVNPKESCLPDHEVILAAYRARDNQAPLNSCRLRVARYLAEDSEERVSMALLTERLWKNVLARRLFVTKNGNLGMGHETLQTGDQVWLLQGAKVPFILRPRDNGTMMLIGEAYIDGMMFGEMWPENGEGLAEVVLT